MDNHYKVSVKNLYQDYAEVDLLVPSQDNMTTKLGDAKGHFLIWWGKLVIF